MNYNCPICTKDVKGEAVRDVNFCEEHREMAVSLLDIDTFKKLEKDLDIIIEGFLFAASLWAYIAEIENIEAKESVVEGFKALEMLSKFHKTQH